MKHKLKLSAAAFGLGFHLVSGGVLPAQEDVEQHKSCVYCGMDRGQFAHSRMLVTYEDGRQSALCSLHCAAVALVVDPDKTPRRIEVGDYGTKKLIEAEKAYWVIGGDKPGVMTRRGKWAFENEAAAGLFVKSHGGSPATYEQAIKAAFEDMYEDTKMIRDKRKRKRMNAEKSES